MIRRSMRNPPSTGYVRPIDRKFYVWRDRVGGGMSWGKKRRTLWRWCCTLCDPPCYGSRTTEDAWFRIMTVSMPNHFYHRKCHHQFVARTRAR